MTPAKTPLPIDPALPEIVEAARAHRGLVLVAPPGAGKTTRVPVAVVEAGLLATKHPALVMLQPRRVAARASAGRIAAENGWRMGEEVGYHIRFERRVGPRTRIRVATEGILLRQLVADPFLEGVGAVVLDEFHERSIHTDLALALLREIKETVRDDLLLIVMSATMDAEPVSEFLRGCPVIRSEGRAYPVEITYRPTAGAVSPEAIARAVEEALSSPGDILVFLPGADEIRRVGANLETLARREDLLVLPLHGALSSEDQDRALRPSERRKVILATNIAETSLTIDGVRTVIDSGLARYASYDPRRGLDRLELGPISRNSAAQRAGRAGRTGPGRCLRLWSEGEQRGREEADVPEIRRVDLCAAVLALHAWGVTDPRRFDWYEAPPEVRIDSAERLLRMLGALDVESGRITARGRQLHELPVHPRIGRLLMAAAQDGWPDEGAALAALLSEEDIVRHGAARDANASSRPRSRGASDLIVRLDLLEEAERDRFAERIRDRGIDPARARRVARLREELSRISRRLGSPAVSRPGGPDEDSILRWIMLAYPDRIARRRADGESLGVMVGGRGIRLGPESVVRDSEFFVALDPREDRRGGMLEARVRSASAIHHEWLERSFPESVRRERSVVFDEQRQKVVGRNALWYLDLLVREDHNAAVDDATASRVLAEALRPRASDFFREDEAAANWLARLQFLRHWVPESDLPDIDATVLSELLEAVCTGKRGVAEVRKVPLVPFLRGRLSHSQGRFLDEHAPETMTVPSGNRVRLTYEPDRPPVLAVRLQELFGWADTPRVAMGRVPIVLHLLGPNFRPVQITDDLRSFWATTYFQVRKDLRARYPKHAWPEDPKLATAQAKGRSRPS